MNKFSIRIWLVCVVALLTIAHEGLARGGFRGGGGRGGGARMGGGMSRPSPRSPSMSRPSRSPSYSRPPSRSPSYSRPSTPSARPRPSQPSSRNRPTTGGRSPGSVNYPKWNPSTPQIGQRQVGSPNNRVGNRPAGTPNRSPGNRVGDRVGQTPGQLPGNTRPGNTRPGNTRPGNTRPGNNPPGNNRPGNNRPGDARPGNRPATLPGLGAAAGAAGLGSRLSSDMQSQLQNRRNDRGSFRDRDQPRFENREQMVDSRRDNLQSRFEDRQGGREDRQDFRRDQLDDRQEFRDNAREDWQDWADDNRWDGHWDCDHWHGHFGDYWDHMWDEHPVYSAFRVTAWGINRANYLFGWGSYYNPYPVETYPIGSTGKVIDYSQPLVSDVPMEQYVVPEEATADGGEAPVESSASDVPPEAIAGFDAAREQFKAGDYEGALNSVDQAIAVLPKDATLHEFRALTLFALGRYRESAAAIHAVLAVGPGWNWTTMSGLYSSTDEYADQLHALEDNIRENPNSADTRFLLAYHYLTLGHNDNAKQQFEATVKLEPKDSVAVDLLTMVGGEPPAGSAPTDSSEPRSKATEAELLGSWTATSAGSSFKLTLDKSGEFTWSYTQDGKTQSLSGVFVVDDGVLALEPDSGGVMLAEVSSPEGGKFSFQQPGDATKELVFTEA